MLSAHLEQNNLLFDYQFGFRKKRSTSLAILDFVNRITDSIDGGGTSIGVFLDLSKAFDTVNHDILLNKLSYYGINNEKKNWFSSYLKNRKQYVCMGYRKALTLALYYFLYISMMLNLLQTLFMLRADDINLLVSDKSLKTSVAVLNND